MTCVVAVVPGDVDHAFSGSFVILEVISRVTEGACDVSWEV